MTDLEEFRKSIHSNSVESISAGLIGRNHKFETPFGTKELLYADFVASGRALKQVEEFIADHVLPFYANSHTEASHCGKMMTGMRNAARGEIARLVNADDECHVVFTGSGATAGINRIVSLLEIPKRVRCGERIVVLIGPYEHHSNILPWRESGAEVFEIAEAEHGGVDLEALSDALKTHASANQIIGSFSAASNVTGIITESNEITRVLKSHGALAIWDYAGGAPYLPIDMCPASDCLKDAVVFSPHKFPGGPGASGVMIVRNSVVRRKTPSAPGGGTVSFVSPWAHCYSTNVAVREEAGTPNVIGDIRAALAMIVKDVIGCDWILARDVELREHLIMAWHKVPSIRLLGKIDGVKALPIFSFQVVDKMGALIHHQLFTRMLSDHLGLQTRGGCACAGTYAHRLLSLGNTESEMLSTRLHAGCEMEKPGWVRLNLSYLHSDEEVERIIKGVIDLAERAEELARGYIGDPATARFHVDENTQKTMSQI
jgi:selenocysteine lyase/cysteine desulfurase